MTQPIRSLKTHFLVALAISATLCAQSDKESDRAAVYEQAANMLKDSSSPELTVFGAKLMQVAADAGHPKAQSVVGYLLAEGKSLPSDLPRAVSYLSLAAATGDPAAATNLRKLYESRLNALPDQQKLALSALVDAADHERLPASIELGQLYYFGGGGVQADQAKAAPYVRSAAEAGDANSMNLYATMLLEGIGLPNDPKAAVAFFKKAAETGHAKAQASLGMAYAGGNGVDRDLVQAFRWMRLSAMQNEVTGKNALADFIRGLTREQIIAGHEDVAAFLRSKGRQITIEELNEEIFHPKAEPGEETPNSTSGS